MRRRRGTRRGTRRATSRARTSSLNNRCTQGRSACSPSREACAIGSNRKYSLRSGRSRARCATLPCYSNRWYDVTRHSDATITHSRTPFLRSCCAISSSASSLPRERTIGIRAAKILLESRNNRATKFYRDVTRFVRETELPRILAKLVTRIARRVPRAGCRVYAVPPSNFSALSPSRTVPEDPCQLRASR